MNEFEKIVEISESNEVKLAGKFRDLLHTELMFGMSSYVCKHGALGDGFENITPAKRYYNAIRESFTRYEAIAELQCKAMECQAELMDAEAHSKSVDRAWFRKKQKRLIADARLRRAKMRLATTLAMTEDNKRQLTAFLEVVNELQAQVRAQYPKGIEQAEPDNWKAVAQFRSAMQAIKGKDQHLEHLPIPMDDKAKLALELQEPALAAWYAIDKGLKDFSPQLIQESLERSDAKRLLSSVR